MTGRLPYRLKAPPAFVISVVYRTLPRIPTTGCGVCGVSISRTAGFSVSLGTLAASLPETSCITRRRGILSCSTSPADRTSGSVWNRRGHICRFSALLSATMLIPVWGASKVHTIAFLGPGAGRRSSRRSRNPTGPRTPSASTVAARARFAADATEVREGCECGLTLNNFNDVRVADVIETYEMREKARV